MHCYQQIAKHLPQLITRPSTSLEPHTCLQPSTSVLMDLTFREIAQSHVWQMHHGHRLQRAR